MTTVLREDKDQIAILRLNNGVTNAISPLLVNDLAMAVNACRHECRGMVLAGGNKFFSIGFDLPGLLTLDRSGIADFYHCFNQGVLTLFTLPCPTVCALSSHAIAGGTILTLTCDYRFAAPGKKLLGLNEIRLGVPVPYLADLMLRLIVAERAATGITYRGEFITTADALQIGLVDEVFAPGAVEERAVERVHELAALPRPAFSQIKDSRIAATRSEFEKNHMQKMNAFLDCWFNPAVRELLTEAAEKFKKNEPADSGGTNKNVH